MKLVIATGNRNKIIEIKNKFSDAPHLEIIPLSEFRNIPEIIEDSDTFSGNAMKKARIIRDFTGLPSMADDSGLVIDALDGEPGVYSARYGGDGLDDRGRYLLVLEKMKTVPEGKRGARFVCAIAVAMPDGREFLTEGICEGTISLAPAGAKGFGYDPVFYLPEFGKTMAELDLNVKNSISHRGKALELVSEIIKELACEK
ncbi:MAG TPA: XTP/dITP diphosphatase [Spirochaetota bacterium]|nr:XTP/dITP diphosphatase [Spirochaetota bacterium]